jgi:hypothetical protein
LKVVMSVENEEVKREYEQLAHKHSFRGWAEVFTILDKYYPNSPIIKSEYNLIFLYVNPLRVSPEDSKRLNELGWVPSIVDEAFLKYL